MRRFAFDPFEKRLRAFHPSAALRPAAKRSYNRIERQPQSRYTPLLRLLACRNKANVPITRLPAYLRAVSSHSPRRQEVGPAQEYGSRRRFLVQSLAVRPRMIGGVAEHRPSALSLSLLMVGHAPVVSPQASSSSGRPSGAARVHWPLCA